MDLNTTWFLLIAVLLTGYAILDGFDLGVGVLHLLTKDEEERRTHMDAVGPVWDGNEVWLLTGGGALFAAFPVAYATVFSGFYLALMLVLAALIARAVSLEFRHKVDSPAWRWAWDQAFGIGSLVPAVLFGVAVGNVLMGVPLDQEGNYWGTFVGLLNPYALLFGLLSLAMFTMQGAAFLALKTEGLHARRMRLWAQRAWLAFVLLFALATIWSLARAPHLFVNVLVGPFSALFFALFVAAVAYFPFALRTVYPFRALAASSLAIAASIGLAAAGLFPRLVPSSTDLGFSLTIYNAASTPKTQSVMLVIALLGMPLVIGYTVWIYRVFKGPAQGTYSASH